MTRTSVLSMVLGASMVLAAASTSVAQTRTSDPKADLDAAKALYASASYDEALAKSKPSPCSAKDAASSPWAAPPMRSLCSSGSWRGVRCSG